VITSTHNEQLKLVRKLRAKKHRERTGLCVVEGEDLVEAALAAGARVEAMLRGGEDVEPGLLAEVSELGSGTRVLAIVEQRWSEPGGRLSVYLEGVRDPGNVGTLIRAAHALCDGPVVLGPGCADPFSPKALRASMGSAFARPPARAALDELEGTLVALDARAAPALRDVDVEAPAVVVLGAEREGLSEQALARAAVRARIPLAPGGPDSLNVAIAGALALYELAPRMAGDG
jgi:RNA methyltransferase, TrmH family